MCQINVSKALYVECGHTQESSFRTNECDEYKKNGKCPNEKKNYLAQTKKRGECPDCETTSTKPEEEAWRYYKLRVVTVDSFWLKGSKASKVLSQMNLRYNNLLLLMNTVGRNNRKGYLSMTLLPNHVYKAGTCAPRNQWTYYVSTHLNSPPHSTNTMAAFSY